MRNAHEISVGKLEVKPLGRLKHRWEDNTTMNLKTNRVGNFGLDSPGSG
jgi:hypothetical protein